jgi:hypothetical protein
MKFFKASYLILSSSSVDKVQLLLQNFDWLLIFVPLRISLDTVSTTIVSFPFVTITKGAIGCNNRAYETP